MPREGTPKTLTCPVLGRPQRTGRPPGWMAATGASTMKDMGKVMAHLKERYAGRMDFGRVGAAVKAKLQG